MRQSSLLALLLAGAIGLAVSAQAHGWHRPYAQEIGRFVQVPPWQEGSWQDDSRSAPSVLGIITPPPERFA